MNEGGQESSNLNFEKNQSIKKDGYGLVLKLDENLSFTELTQRKKPYFFEGVYLIIFLVAKERSDSEVGIIIMVYYIKVLTKMFFVVLIICEYYLIEMKILN